MNGKQCKLCVTAVTVQNSSRAHSGKILNSGWYKCNVDAAFHSEVGKTTAGWCIRDYLGRFVLAGSSWIQGRCAVIEGEAVAVLEAIEELSHRGFRKVIFETDSKIVDDAVHSIHDDVSEFSFIIRNIKCILSLHSDFEVKSTNEHGCSGYCKGGHFMT
ncbi:BZIP-like protein [Trifolium pratense]|uniref:BZIP-like protein n=1 Tax=Trifolium pratense TaxID=57577 RepID=A0A2K3MUB6_TRIPR|nr:BZIP-like protein [Trifolium pratense]